MVIALAESAVIIRRGLWQDNPSLWRESGPLAEQADAEDLKCHRAGTEQLSTRNQVQKSPEIDERAVGRCETNGNQDAVDDALAEALRAATAAGQWSVVSQLAVELQQRRLAKSENVVPLHNSVARKSGR